MLDALHFVERGNQKEFNMYIGGGLLLLLIVLFLVLRWAIAGTGESATKWTRQSLTDSYPTSLH